MAITFSTELLNKAAEGYGVRELLRDGRLYLYTGTSPGVNAAATGTLLNIYTLSGGAFTPPVRAVGTATISGSGGTVDTIKVGGMAENLLSAAVAWDTDVTTTAVAVAANINAKQNALNITADNTAGVVNLYAPFWLGALADGLTVASTETTLVVTDANFSTGTTALNGLNFKFPAVAGVLSKETTIWQGTAAATGTAGYFRFVAGGSTVSGVGGTDVRFDGSVGTSGADLNLSSTSIASASEQTISGFDINVGQ